MLGKATILYDIDFHHELVGNMIFMGGKPHTSGGNPDRRLSGMIKQQMSLRRGLAAIGAAIASVAMLMTVSAGAPAAAAAGSSIDLKSVTGAKLDGHDFKAYRIGDYSNPVVDAGTGKVSSVSVRNRADSTPAIQSWLSSALSANGVSILVGDDEAATISRITDAGTIAKVARSLAASSSKPTESGSLNGTGTSGTITLDADGLYLITDSKGNPMIIGTKVDGKDMVSQPLGVAVIKSTDTADTDMVSALLLDTSRVAIPTTNAVTAGQDAIVRINASLPTTQNASGVSFDIDQLSGFDFKGNVKLYKVAADGSTTAITDVTPAVDGVRAAAPLHRITLDAADIAKHPGERIAVEYDVQVLGIVPPTLATDKMSMKVLDNAGDTTVFENEHTTVTAFTSTFDLHKLDIDGTTKLTGAKFRVARKDGSSIKWMNRASTDMWSEVASESAAGEFETAGANGSVTIAGLGDGTYRIKETKAPDGHLLFGGVSADITITHGKLSAVSGVDAPNLSSLQSVGGGDGYVQVKNISSITQLPQTGMNHWDLFAIIGTVIVVLIVGTIIIVRTRGERKREENRTASRNRRRR